MSDETRSIGQHAKVLTATFEVTVRFVNLLNEPPVGVRYEILIGKKIMAKGTVGLSENEASFLASDNASVSLKAQKIGDTELQHVSTFAASRAHPVIIVRLNSAKLPSTTEQHPKTSTVGSAGKPASKPSAESATPSKKDQGLPNKPAKNANGAAEHLLLPGECACKRDITIDELAAIFPSRKKAELTPYLEPLNKMMKTYQIDTCLKKAHALAQMGHESGYLKNRVETLPKGVTEEKAYDGYMGRGLIQITLKNNYTRYGKYKGEDFLEENRLKLETHEYATDSAGWYWNYGTPYALNDYAAANDLIFISAAINGGFNGFDDRAQIFEKSHKILNATSCKDEKNRSSDYLSFEKSKAYTTRDMAFAWGLWSDPDEKKKKGLEKDAEKSKAGYKRFLELNKENPAKNKRFGFKDTKAMIEHAEERSK